jgi:hypothetical protein
VATASLKSRAILGGAAGAFLFIVDAFASGLRVVVNPGVAERVTSGGVLAMVTFLPVWIAVGIVVAVATTIRVPIVRNLVIGAIVGGTGWTYLATTWSVTARTGFIGGANGGVFTSIAMGTALGVFAGLFLWIMRRLRRRGRVESANP